MPIFKKPTLWLSLLLVSMLALPGWSLPRSMIMTLEVSSKQGTRPVKATTKLWYANQKFRAEVTSSGVQQPANATVRIGNKATIIMDLKAKIGYLIDDGSKTALRLDQTQVAQMSGGNKPAQGQFTDPASLTDPAKVKAEIQRQGGRQIGKEKLLGHQCTIWQMTGKAPVPVAQGKTETQNVTTKVWLADALGMPLKVIVTADKSGEVMNMRATQIQVDVPVNAGLFGVPAGYKVQDMAQLYKQGR
ncbi:MAG: hypothetical protein ACO1RX_05330 [Candidatus Sericytochromatia bacterium]